MFYLLVVNVSLVGAGLKLAPIAACNIPSLLEIFKKPNGYCFLTFTVTSFISFWCLNRTIASPVLFAAIMVNVA
ncbi:hypothetical protein B188_25290 [Candidatus Brocadiaceae bacterium B188]|nr:hypothetical protein B188_25290 [Candidatus Brocadiaceae bacterium B188]